MGTHTTRSVLEGAQSGVAPFNAGGIPNNIPDTMYQNAREVFQAILDMTNGEDAKPFISIKLPFKCLQAFVDPYVANQGHCIRNYSHENQPPAWHAAVAAAVNNGVQPTAPTRRICVFHVNLQGADVAREHVRTTNEDDIDM